MAKEVKQEVKVVEEDFVKLVKEAVQGHGSSSFLRVNLDREFTQAGKNAVYNDYGMLGYEAFFSADNKSVVLLKQ